LGAGGPQICLDDLFTERERAQVTLDSIGDAVASTDFAGNVAYLNKAAERLTGVREAAARKRPIGEVLRLVDAVSGEPVGNPATAAIIENQKRSAGGNCLLLRRNNTCVPVEVSATPIHDRLGGVVGAVIVAHDVSAARGLSEKLARLALYDHLTGLPNRTLFTDRLDQAISSAKRTGSTFSLLYIDLDHFKEVNDTRGHETGDQLLQMAAERLLRCVRDSDTVSRQGGDEFLALLMDCAGESAAVACARKIVDTLRLPYKLNGERLQISATVGIALYPSDATDRLSLIRAADTAMYRAKCAGRGSFSRFSAKTPDLASTTRESNVLRLSRSAKPGD